MNKFNPGLKLKLVLKPKVSLELWDLNLVWLKPGLNLFMHTSLIE